MSPKRGDKITPQERAYLGDSAMVTRRVQWKTIRARKTKETGDLPQDGVIAAVSFIIQGIIPREQKWAEGIIWDLKHR